MLDSEALCIPAVCRWAADLTFAQFNFKLNQSRYLKEKRKQVLHFLSLSHWTFHCWMIIFWFYVYRPKTEIKQLQMATLWEAKYLKSMEISVCPCGL